jgi:hypothetical protein
VSTLFFSRNDLEAMLPTICKNFDKGQNRWRKTSTVAVGPPGTGKTTMIFTMAKHPDLVKWYNGVTGLELAEVPVYTTSCHPDATAPEVYGQYLPLDGNWTFIPGSMLRAWGYNWHGEHVGIGPGPGVIDPTGYDAVCKTPPPGIHLLDDIHLMGPGGQAAMYKSFDNGVGANFMDPFGKLHFPHEAALAFGTMNGEINSLDEAVVDRCGAKPLVMEPSTAMLANLEEDMRELCAADYTDNLEPIATYREWLSISQLRPVVGLAKAVVLALGKEDRAKKLIEALAKVEASGVFGTKSREAREALKAIVEGTPA